MYGFKLITDYMDNTGSPQWCSMDDCIKAAFGAPLQEKALNTPSDTGYQVWKQIRNDFDRQFDYYRALTVEGELWLMLNTPAGAEALS